MFAGHYGISFLVKKSEPTLPLWTLFLAVQFLDVLWAVFVLLGIEHYRIVPGITASLPLDLYYMPYTHSLVASVVWSAVVFVLCRWVIPVSAFRNNRAAFLLALAVFSHWMLDLVVHRPDLPLYDDAYKLGLGLWNYPRTALGLEAALFFGAMCVYLRSTTATSFAGRYGMIFFGLVILTLHCLLFWGPLPSSPTQGAAELGALYFILSVGAFWLERSRTRLT